MPFVSSRAKLFLTDDEVEHLARISNSRSESAGRVLRSNILLQYNRGQTVSAISRDLEIDRPRVQLTVEKALDLGALPALNDLPRRGRHSVITDEAKTWLVSLACQKPIDLGYSYELWTTDLLARHVRSTCQAAGHPSLSRLARGTVSKILSSHAVQPHKINYYLERRDPDFDQKMAQVLCIYRDVHLWHSTSVPESIAAVLSYDEKPGIQAIGNTAPDLPPVFGMHSTTARDYEYVRSGTMSLLAAIDLIDGQVHGIVRERHRSAEFVEFLDLVDNKYPADAKIRIILDNHSAHISRETRRYLATKPNRFEFIFTPKHGSWLNIIESFFAKMAKTMLRGMRAGSKDEIIRRIELYLEEVNQMPVVFKWKYKLDEIQVV
jgi:transposase